MKKVQTILYKMESLIHEIDFRSPLGVVRERDEVLDLVVWVLHVVAHIEEVRQLQVEQRGVVAAARARAAVRRRAGGGGVIQPGDGAGRRCGHAGADVVVVVAAARHRAAPLLEVRRVGLLDHLHQRRDVELAVGGVAGGRLHAVAGCRGHLLGLVLLLLSGGRQLLRHRRRARVDQVRHLARGRVPNAGPATCVSSSHGKSCCFLLLPIAAGAAVLESRVEAARRSMFG